MSNTPRQRRQIRTRRAILDAARHIVGEQGLPALSLRAIARRIDYSPAGLYEYFENKEAIIQAVAHEGHLRLSAFQNQVDATLPPSDYLLGLGLAYITFAVRHPDYYLLMFTTTPERPVSERMLVEGSSYPILLNAIQRGLDEGIFAERPGFSKAEMAYAAWALVHGMAMLRITFMREAPIEFSALDRHTLLSMQRGFAPEG